MAITSVTKDTDAISYVEDGVTKKISVSGSDTVVSFPIDDCDRIINMWRQQSDGHLIITYIDTNGDEQEIDLDPSGVSDHGELDGLADDDHTQYIRHSLATAASNFLVASGAGAFIKKTLAEVKTLLGIATSIATHAAIKAANATLGHVIVETGSSIDVDGDGKLTLGDVSDFLEGTPTEDEDEKAPTSEWAYDHKEAVLSVHGIDAAGIYSLATQSAASAWQDEDQPVPNKVNTIIKYDTENYDVQNEFDSSSKDGTATATTADHLIDTTLNPFVAGDVGKTVLNTTDDTYAVITTYNSTSDVTIDTDIMASGEGYNVYFSRFTATEDGKYPASGGLQITLIDIGDYLSLKVFVNGAEVFFGEVKSPTDNNYLTTLVACTLDLSAGDYVEFRARHDYGANRDTLSDQPRVWFSIVKTA